MQSSLEKLRKLFRLEHENGYSNTAVIGGLANILSYWEGEARNTNIPEETVQAVASTLMSYAGRSPEDRSESLKALWKSILTANPEETSPRIQLQVQPSKPVAANSSPKPTPSNPNPTSVPIETSVAFQEQEPPNSQSPKEHPEHPSQAPVNLNPAIPVPQTSHLPRHLPGRADSRPGANTSKRPIALNASLTVLAGVGPRHASMLTRLGLNTLGDMLYNFPRRYDDYSQLKPIRDLFYGQDVTVIGEVTLVNTRPLRGGKMTIIEVVINDGTGGLRLTWFNQPWLANRLKVGDAISVSGRVEQYLGRLVMNSPDWEPVEAENLSTNRIVPVYPLTANVTQKWLRKLMSQVVYILGSPVDRSLTGYHPSSRLAPGPGHGPVSGALSGFYGKSASRSSAPRLR